jgi:hypothetical protein
LFSALLGNSSMSNNDDQENTPIVSGPEAAWKIVTGFSQTKPEIIAFLKEIKQKYESK